MQSKKNMIYIIKKDKLVQNNMNKKNKKKLV